MHIVVLGSAAGGGVPQWNCACPVCRLAWRGDPRVRPRTQSSVAVSVDGADWLLLNASPDIRQQIASCSPLHPGPGLRQSPLLALLVTNGDVDHIAGLLSLRERQSLTLYGTEETLKFVGANPIFDVMAHDKVERRKVTLDQWFEPLPGLKAEIFAVPGKVPLWLEQEGGEPGDGGAATVGVALEAEDRRIVYIPGCATLDEALLQRIEGCDLLFFDGTVWRDDDMIAAGVGTKTGRRMGHMPISGVDGSIAALADLSVGQRVFIHINNTNLILIEGSAEHAAVAAAGWTVAHDGLEFEL